MQFSQQPLILPRYPPDLFRYKKLNLRLIFRLMEAAWSLLTSDCYRFCRTVNLRPSVYISPAVDQYLTIMETRRTRRTAAIVKTETPPPVLPTRELSSRRKVKTRRWAPLQPKLKRRHWYSIKRRMTYPSYVYYLLSFVTSCAYKTSNVNIGDSLVVFREHQDGWQMKITLLKLYRNVLPSPAGN